MKGKRIILKRTGRVSCPESMGEELCMSGLETEEGVTSAKAGQRAVLRKKLSETRGKASAVLTSEAHIQKLYREDECGPCLRITCKLVVFHIQIKNLKTSGI